MGPGIGLHYRIFGRKGDTVIVIPGGPGLGSQYLEPGLVGLADSHVVVFLDPRGTGRSTPVPDTLQQSAALAVADLESLRSALGIQRVSLIAHHWGAVVALLYAKAHPEHVTRLALVSPSPAANSIVFQVSTIPVDGAAAAAYGADVVARQDSIDPQRFCRRNWSFLFAPLAVTDREVVRRLGPSICAAPSAVLRGVPAMQRELMRSLGTRNLRDSLEAIAVPTLVLQGDGHPIVLDGAQRWALWVRNGRFILLGRPSLFPWLNDRARFLSSLDRFLDGDWPEGAEPPPPPRSSATADSTAVPDQPAS